MLRNVFIKEWKERLPLFFFAAAVFLVYAGLCLGLTDKKDALGFLTGAVTLVFLPVFGLLLGSSGFHSEFRDGAWAYLFSRPVKKQQIWLTKYLSLLSVLLAAAAVLALIVEIVPGVKGVLADLSFQPLGKPLSLFALGLIWSLIFLTTSFALAIFSDKPHIVIFLALLPWAALYALFILVYWSSLQVWLYSVSVLWMLLAVGLLCLSLALASVFTFSRADFSQPKRKAWHFAKWGMVFIAASVIISAGVFMATSRAGIFSHISSLEISSGAAYFHFGKGIYKYDLESRRRQRMSGAYVWEPLSVGGDCVVFVKEVLRSGSRMSEEVWIMDTDGRNARPLVDTSREGELFYDLLIWGVKISSDGRTVALLTRNRRDQHTFHWMKSDESGIRSLSLDMPKIRFVGLVGFSGSGKHVLLQCVHQARGAESGASLLKVDLDHETIETLAINVHRPHLAALSGKDAAAYIIFDEIRRKEILLLRDLETDAQQEVLAADSIVAFRWTEAGDMLAIWTGKANLSVYSPAEGMIITEKDMKGYDVGVPLAASGRRPNETRWILCRTEQGKKSICLLDRGLNEVKAIPIPWASGEGVRLEASGKVIFAWEYDQPRLWAVDLETEKWRRIY